MPNPQGARQSIRSRIKTYLIDPHPEIPWIFREETGHAMLPTGEHVIIDILPGRARQVATGSPRLFRTRGTTVWRIATPPGGAGRNEEIAELIHPHFRSLIDTSVSPAVRYYTPVWAPSEVPDETWFIGRSVVEWECDYNEV